MGPTLPGEWRLEVDGMEVYLRVREKSRGVKLIQLSTPLIGVKRVQTQSRSPHDGRSTDFEELKSKVKGRNRRLRRWTISPFGGH